MRTKRLTLAAIIAITFAFAIFASVGDDILRAVCAGLGPDHPLYDVMGCPAVAIPPSPEG